MALFLSILLPGVLFVASLMRLLGCIKRRSDGLFEYVWATGYTMVLCLASTWLAADLVSLRDWTLPDERATLVLQSGPSLFVALGFMLVMRPVARGIGGVLQFAVSKLRAIPAAIFSRRKPKK